MDKFLGKLSFSKADLKEIKNNRPFHILHKLFQRKGKKCELSSWHNFDSKITKEWYKKGVKNPISLGT